MYVKNDVFDAFYDDYVQYKEYMNDIINTLIPKENLPQKQNSKEASTGRCSANLLLTFHSKASDIFEQLYFVATNLQFNL